MSRFILSALLCSLIITSGCSKSSVLNEDSALLQSSEIRGKGKPAPLSPSPSPTATAYPMPSPSASPSPNPTATTSPSPSPSASPTTSPSPSPSPTVSPSPSPSPAPSPTTSPVGVPPWQPQGASVESTMGATIDFPANLTGYDFTKLTPAVVKIARFGVEWGYLETTLGQYNFAWSDQIISTLIANGIRPMVLLNTSNALYDSTYGIYALPSGTTAMNGWLNYVKALVNRNKGKNIIWEIFNEPNTWKFWKNNPTPIQYSDFLNQTLAAIQSVAPGESLIGFSLASFGNLNANTTGTYLDYAFPILNQINAGPAQNLSGISIHPYRGLSNPAPESAQDDYRNFRRLLSNALGANIPTLVQGECGWNVNDLQSDFNRQARFLVRQHLLGLMNGLPFNIIYKLIGKPSRPDDDFGVYANDGSIRPAATALKFLSNHLNGYRFNKSLKTGINGAYALLFTNGNSNRIVVWAKDATSVAPITLTLPIPSGSFSAVDIQGNWLGSLTANSNLSVTLSDDSPLYLTPTTGNTYLSLAQTLEAVSPEIYYSCPTTSPLSLKFTNPTTGTLNVRLNSGDAFTSVASGQTVALKFKANLDCSGTTQKLDVSLEVSGYPLMSQTAIFSPLTPFRIQNIPSVSSQHRVEVQNLNGRSFTGTLRANVGGTLYNQTVNFVAGEFRKEMEFTIPSISQADYSVETLLLDSQNNILTTTGVKSISKLIPSLSICNQGSIPAELSISSTVGSSASPACSYNNLSSINQSSLLPLTQVLFGNQSETLYFNGDPRISLGGSIDLQTFIPTTGGNFFLNTSRAVSTSTPDALGFWIATDALTFSPNSIPITVYIQLKDASGQIHQIHTMILPASNWQYIEMSLDPSRYAKVDHWGGANDGVVHYPVTMQTFSGFALWSNYSISGRMSFSNPILVQK